MLELSPVDDYAHYALGRSLLQQGRAREASTHLKLARFLQPRELRQGEPLGSTRSQPQPGVDAEASRPLVDGSSEIREQRRVAAVAPASPRA